MSYKKLPLLYILCITIAGVFLGYLYSSFNSPDKQVTLIVCLFGLILFAVAICGSLQVVVIDRIAKRQKS